MHLVFTHMPGESYRTRFMPFSVVVSPVVRVTSPSAVKSLCSSVHSAFGGGKNLPGGRAGVGCLFDFVCHYGRFFKVHFKHTSGS